MAGTFLGFRLDIILSTLLYNISRSSSSSVFSLSNLVSLELSVFATQSMGDGGGCLSYHHCTDFCKNLLPNCLFFSYCRIFSQAESFFHILNNFAPIKSFFYYFLVPQPYFESYHFILSDSVFSLIFSILAFSPWSNFISTLSLICAGEGGVL